MMRPSSLAVWAGALGLALIYSACQPQSSFSLVDQTDGKTAANFPDLTVDVFRAMDEGIALDDEEIKGRNTWNLWCGGNERFWDRMARESHGMIDLLKTIDSRGRTTRFKEMGLINQPGFRPASQPDGYGLWIDEPSEPESSSIDPRVYGRATGIMGFRLFPNPEFDDQARRAWDADRYYRDSKYAADPTLIRPYRVGVSCGACHIAFNPVNPPADPANPRWENLSSAIGNQYLREGRVFAHAVTEGSFFWEMLKAQPPGTSDTSRIATDHINNPNAINPIFLIGSRLAIAHAEVISGETLLLPNPGRTREPSATRVALHVPMVLKDGADSVGMAGALLRVYVNTGTFSQYWLQQHQALLGLRPQRPFEVSVAQKNSVYWNATERKVGSITKFFLRLKPLRLADAPGGKTYLTTDSELLRRGKLVFASECARCHSSKRPPSGIEEEEWFAEQVLQPEFNDDNFFADERRHSVTKIQTNAARAFGTNARAGHIWQNFSSDDYKALPSPGEIEVDNPYSGRREKIKTPAGGPGYYRTASLISLWSSAPFFHNNALGRFTGDPSVEGRMEAFNDAVQKLLWPEKRLGRDSIWRTSRECFLQIQIAVLPEPLQTMLRPHAEIDGTFRLGPIPEGTPINLLGNLNPDARPVDLVKLCLAIKATLATMKEKQLTAGESKALMRDQVAPLLWAANTCPDLIEDHGHTFGSELPDPDKYALIEYLKTL